MTKHLDSSLSDTSVTKGSAVLRAGCAPGAHLATRFLDTRMDNGNELRSREHQDEGSTAKVLSLLEAVAARLEAVERKVDAITVPPKALRIEEAEKHLPLKRAAIKDLIRKGKIRTVQIGERNYIPLTEIIRLTSLPDRAPSSAPAVHRSKKARATDRAVTESDAILDVVKSLKKRRR